jgi:hypothetical protein
VFGTVFGIAAGIALAIAGVIASGIPGGIRIGIAAGIGVGIMNGLSHVFIKLQEHDDASITWDPRQIIKHDLTLGTAIGIAFPIAVVILFGTGLGINLGLTFGITLGPAFGQVGFRYVAMLLCTRGWFGTPALPWRLGRFLNWCYDTGLVRQAGVGYQFRHRELQDHLAHHPQPAQASV